MQERRLKVCVVVVPQLAQRVAIHCDHDHERREHHAHGAERRAREEARRRHVEERAPDDEDLDQELGRPGHVVLDVDEPDDWPEQHLHDTRDDVRIDDAPSERRDDVLRVHRMRRMEREDEDIEEEADSGEDEHLRVDVLVCRVLLLVHLALAERAPERAKRRVVRKRGEDEDAVDHGRERREPARAAFPKALANRHIVLRRRLLRRLRVARRPVTCQRRRGRRRRGALRAHLSNLNRRHCAACVPPYASVGRSEVS